MLSTGNKAASMSISEAASIIGKLGGRPGKYYLSGFVSIIPVDNLLYLGDQQLTLGTKPLSLGPADMAIDISNPGTDGPALSAALGPLLGLIYNPDTGQVGVGLTDFSQLDGRLSVKPTEAALGDNIIVNPDFNGNANNWNLSTSWVYDTNKITTTNSPSIDFGMADITGTQGTGLYRVTLTISNSSGFQFLLGSLGDENNAFNINVDAGDGVYTSDQIASFPFTSFKISPNSASWTGSITNVSVQKIGFTRALNLTNGDSIPAIQFDTLATNLGTVANIGVDLDANLNIIPGNQFAISNPNKVLFDFRNVGMDESLLFPATNPDSQGDIPLDSTQVAVADLIPPANRNDTGVRFVYDSTVAYSAAVIGTAPVGGGSNFNPLYWDANQSMWLIG